MNAAHAATEELPPAPRFRAVYAEHFAFVWRTLRRLGVREADLEDAAQEAFVVVYRKLDDFDPRRPIKPWLVGIAHRVATAERRRARHRREQLGGDELAARRVCRGPSADALIEARQRRDRVLAALDTLDPDRRLVFVMHEMEGIPCTEIVEAIDVPVNTVYSRLRVARARFSAAIERLRLRRGEA